MKPHTDVRCPLPTRVFIVELMGARSGGLSSSHSTFWQRLVDSFQHMLILHGSYICHNINDLMLSFPVDTWGQNKQNITIDA